MTGSLQENYQDIEVLELRNYLLKPGMTDTFSDYFNIHFVNPMRALGGHTIGQFKIAGAEDRFLWMRGFSNMHIRSKFLVDFYVNSPVWKQFGPGANEMMINSDNVYLLRPLRTHENVKEQRAKGNSYLLNAGKGITIVDFYTCNGTLNKVIHLFDTAYLPFLRSSGIQDITLWVSEMAENDFPRLPVFQDKNLLLTLTNYTGESDYELKKEKIISMPADLKNSMQELITIQSQIILLPIS